MNELQIFNSDVMPTKHNAEQIAKSILQQVDEGNINPLQALSRMQWLQTIVETVTKQLRQTATDEAAKYGSKSFEAYGCGFEIAEAGVKYDYSGNDEWDTLQARIDCLRTEQKSIEVILKAQGSYSKTSTTIVKVKLLNH